MSVVQPDQVRITGIRVRTTHGVYEVERVEPQDFVIDLVCSLAVPARDDDLTTTVDYDRLSAEVAAAVAADPVNLIETLAERVATLALADPLIASVQVTVHKPQAKLAVPVDDVAVTITRSQTR